MVDNKERVVRAGADDQLASLPLLPAILETGWLLAAVLTPLWINLWGSQPFDPAKISLLRWLIWLLAAVWLADWLARPRPWRSELPPLPFLLPLLLLAAAAVLSTVAAAHGALAVWGSLQRAYGLLTLLSYLLLTLLVAGRLRSLDQTRRLLAVMAATAVPIILLGALQATGYDPLRLVSDARSPVYATLGRANFVGAYLAMLLPLTLVLALATSQRRLRAGLLLLALGELLLIGLTLARAAWLGAATGLLLLLAGRAWPCLSRRGRYGVSGLAGLLFVGGALLAARGLALADGGSIAARRVIWQTTVTLIGQRPLTGRGLDNLALHFFRLFPPELVYYQGRQVVVDRAHNWLLDTAVTMGLFGLLAVLWLWAVAFWYGWRAAHRLQQQGERERSLLLLGSLAAVAANLSGNLFSFDVAATAVAGWLLLAAIISLSRPPAGAPGVRTAAPARWRPAVAALLLVAALGGGWLANGRFLVADAAQQRSLRLTAQGDWPAATSAARRATALWPHEPAYRQQLARLQGVQGDFDAAGRSWQQAVALRPADPAIWADMGQFYLTLARQGERGALAPAERALAEAAALAPTTARLYLLWGQVYLLAGDWETAGHRFERAVALDATDGLAWAHLAEAYAAEGRLAEAQSAQREAERWHGR